MSIKLKEKLWINSDKIFIKVFKIRFMKIKNKVVPLSKTFYEFHIIFVVIKRTDSYLLFNIFCINNLITGKAELNVIMLKKNY